jgi:hypothetical protein
MGELLVSLEFGALFIKLCVHIFLYGFVGLFQDLDTINDAFGLEDLDSIGDH